MKPIERLRFESAARHIGRKVNSALTRLARISFCVLALFALSASGEKMPVKHLTIADGLPQNSINFIFQDETGFFWFGTNGGLARFDGHEFVNFTQRQGLPSNVILDCVKSRNGHFWLATKSGLVKFDPEGAIYDRATSSTESPKLAAAPMFTTYDLPDKKSRRITKLVQTSSGAIWAGTENGLYRLAENDSELHFEIFDLGLPPPADKFIYEIYEDRKGAVWVGTKDFLTRISLANRITRFGGIPGAVYSVALEDRRNRLWIGTYHRGLFEFAIDDAETPVLVRQFTQRKNSEIEWIDTISESASGSLWLGGSNGLYEFDPASAALFRYTRSSGLDYNKFQTSFVDRSGNLWLGSKANGVYRVSGEGLISFETEDRISFIKSLGFDRDKNLLLTGFLTNTALDEKGAKVRLDIARDSSPPSEWRLGRLDETGFSWTIPKFPRAVNYYGWGENQLSLQARGGEWWIVTGEGLYRFPAVRFEELSKVSPISVFNSQNGLNSDSIFHIYEDSRENIWIATESQKSNRLYKWERATATLHDLSGVEGFAAVSRDFITSFAEDRDGNIWLSFYLQGFARLRDNRIDFWGDARGVPPGGVASLFFDREDRLWLATRENGVVRIDDARAENLRLASYGEAEGLSSGRTFSVAQDQQGIIYIGTDRDVNMLNPQTGRVKRLRLSASQAQREFRSALCDQNGALWFGTTQGLVKYVPAPAEKPDAPDILITGASVEGAAQKVSAIGTRGLILPPLAPGQNQVRINYVSLSPAASEDVNYQYRLGEDENWSPPSKERFVNFANLSPGAYRVSIRAVNSDGEFSPNPAIIVFRISPPFYLRPWFLAACALVFAGLIYAAYRFRVRKLLELEQARTLIATDLHDDIGSNLSKISVLSEVVRMQLGRDGKSDDRLLSSIAEISRESVGSMSDIVWAINPKRDSALEMARKMREYAEEIFVPRGVRVGFSEPQRGAKIKLPMDLRRDLYLIFKEAINNIAKHANCATVSIVFDIRQQEVILHIADDGIGFDRRAQIGGNGLQNMRNRAAKLKGRFFVESEKSGGTKISVRVPQS